ncbi:MAG: HNH endonuclease [Vulcanimicrobiaceae bacterium]
MHESRADYNKRYREQRIAQGLCTQCGADNEGNGSRCPACAVKFAAYMKTRSHRHKSSGKCSSCGKSNDRAGVIQCSDCASRQSRALKRRSAKYKSDGLCVKCGTGLIFGRFLCFDHWFASTANNALKQWDRGPELKALWERQGGRCAITGVALTADNVELDHVVPRSRGGTHDASNLRWVVDRFNWLKRDALDSELEDLCTLALEGLRARKP